MTAPPPSLATRRGRAFVCLPHVMSLCTDVSCVSRVAPRAPKFLRALANWPFLIWMDGVEAGWAVPLLLVGFVAVWFVYLVIAYFDGDLHSDVLETWTLGRSIEWGYSKHPPLMGWVARAWTSVFPLTNWSFQLLALTNAALGLWMVDLITRRFVRRATSGCSCCCC